MSTSKQRCVASGTSFFSGLYPMASTQHSLKSLENFMAEDSPLKGTHYEVLLNQIYDGNCQEGPVITVPSKLETMMRTEGCPLSDDMLKKNTWDMEKVD